MVGPSTTGAGATATVGGAAVAAAAAAKPTPMSLAKDIFRVDGFAGFYKGCVQYENAAAYAAFHQTSATTSTVPFPTPLLSLALALSLSLVLSLSSSRPLVLSSFGSLHIHSHLLHMYADVRRLFWTMLVHTGIFIKTKKGIGHLC